MRPLVRSDIANEVGVHESSDLANYYEQIHDHT